MNRLDKDSLLEKLVQIGIALSCVYNLEELLENILLYSIQITNSDGGTIYLVENGKLKFKISRNKTLEKRLGKDRVKKLFKTFELDINMYSIAGYVALTNQIVNIKDVSKIDEKYPFKYNFSFDKKNNYKTQAMITIPINNPKEEVIGVLQLINPIVDGVIQTFSEEYEDILKAFASQAGVAIENAKLTNRLKEMRLDTIFRLGITAEFKDKETSSHIKRMAKYCELIAQKLGWSKDRIELMLNASPMHDIGKVGIPDSILLKNGPLTPQERKKMEKHTVIGASILQHPSDELLKFSQVVALYHHEKWDGSGYPLGIKGSDIPIEGRIAAVADVFDALSSKRVYKPAFPIEKVVDIFKESRGKHFDPELVDILFENLDEFLIIKDQYKETEEEIEVFDILEAEDVSNYIKKIL